MNEKKLQVIFDILNEMDQMGGPVGSGVLSLRLNIPPASLGRIIQDLEYQGYLGKVSNKGRILTDAGREYMYNLQNELHSLVSTNELKRLAKSTEKDSVLDMLYARRTIEKEVITMACQRITDADIAELRRIVAEQEQEISKEQIGNVQDLRFHLTLARISGNKSFEPLLRLLLMRDDVYVSLSLIALGASNMPNYVSHSQIIDALEARDLQLSCELLLRHIDFYRDYIEKHY